MTTTCSSIGCTCGFIARQPSLPNTGASQIGICVGGSLLCADAGFGSSRIFLQPATHSSQCTRRSLVAAAHRAGWIWLAEPFRMWKHVPGRLQVVTEQIFRTIPKEQDHGPGVHIERNHTFSGRCFASTDRDRPLDEVYVAPAQTFNSQPRIVVFRARIAASRAVPHSIGDGRKEERLCHRIHTAYVQC